VVSRSIELSSTIKILGFTLPFPVSMAASLTIKIDHGMFCVHALGG
jgi:hypothetical protein